MNNSKEHIFKVGDKAILDIGFGFTKGDCCLMYVDQGAEVTIRKVFGEVCEVEFDGATSLVNSYFLTLIENSEFKFKIGDKVIIVDDNPKIVYTVKEHCLQQNGRRLYALEYGNGSVVFIFEDALELYTIKDITDKIKSFEDACEWCKENGYQNLVDALTPTIQSTCDTDIVAYFKLRIITTALNEGWRPTLKNGEKVWRGCSSRNYLSQVVADYDDSDVTYSESFMLFFKTHRMAEYAAKQFKSIYMDFCYNPK